MITHVKTTIASIQDVHVTSDIQEELAAVELLPATHLVDAGYVDTTHLVHSQQNDIDLIGPAPLDTSWQARTKDGLTQSQFVIDWDTKMVTCPGGHSSVTWQHSHSQRNIPLIRIVFDPDTWTVSLHWCGQNTSAKCCHRISS